MAFRIAFPGNFAFVAPRKGPVYSRETISNFIREYKIDIIKTVFNNEFETTHFNFQGMPHTFNAIDDLGLGGLGNIVFNEMDAAIWIGSMDRSENDYLSYNVKTRGRPSSPIFIDLVSKMNRELEEASINISRYRIRDEF